MDEDDVRNTSYCKVFQLLMYICQNAIILLADRWISLDFYVYIEVKFTFSRSADNSDQFIWVLMIFTLISTGCWLLHHSNTWCCRTIYVQMSYKYPSIFNFQTSWLLFLQPTVSSIPNCLLSVHSSFFLYPNLPGSTCCWNLDINAFFF